MIIKNFCILISLPLLVATGCKLEVKKSNTEITPNEVADSMPLETPIINKKNKALNDQAFSKALEGVWNRTSYPFGSLEFKDHTVKITEGEGIIQAPEFKNYFFADVCPFSNFEKDDASFLDFLVLEEDEDCYSIKFKNDTLSISYSAEGSGVQYIRPKSERINLKTIPKILQGFWAISNADCGGSNHNRIRIDSTSIQFFEERSQLIKITAYEPTRISGNFTSQLPNDTTVTSSITLDVQNQGNMLILEDYGPHSQPGSISYKRCE